MTRTFSFSSGFRTLDDIDDFDRDYEPRPLSRAIALMLIATVLMGIQAGRLVYLQLINGVENRQKAENNRIRLIPMPANRGVIIDRKGKPLAANRMTRSVYVWPKEQSKKQWEITAAKLAPVLNVPASSIVNRVERAIEQGEGNTILSRQISPEAFILLNERANDFPGVEVRAESVRYYPQGDLASHLLGYIGEVTKEELDKNPDYRLHMMVGKLGIEASANQILAGQWGDRLIEVNSMSQDLREIGVQAPKDGQTVQMTLDLDLQKAAETALGKRLGAVVVLDVKTGGVLAMASYPRFDPNMFTKPLTEKEWASLQTPENPLLNRALQGYPPGSTFKVVTTAAALGSGKYSVYDVVGTSSAIQVGGMMFNEHSSALGYIGFRDALAFSSNTFFYQVGLHIGPEEIYKWAHNLG
ncbi:MAG: penicillin-binding transpeptidase domain-containing protein, partial [Microcoleaceae cyanobacterium]